MNTSPITNQFPDFDGFSKKKNIGNTPRIAIVGCGAIAERFYLPALAENRSVMNNLVLVDTNEVRTKKLASKFNVPNILQDYHEILNKVEGVIIALPHYLHYKISKEFLACGVHVLCEKPLTESGQEARELVAQARKSGVTISVNHTRRLFPSYIEIKKLISNGTIGDLISIKYSDGKLFSWPTISGFYFRKASPRGVLFDKGIHSVDTICWWLDGKPKVVSSENDSFGRIETVALVKFVRNACNVEVKLSWLSKLPNTFTIVGEHGIIEGDIEEWDIVTIKSTSGKRRKIRLNSKEKTYNDFGHAMLANFLNVVRKGEKPLVPASNVIPAIDLIEECYQSAKRFKMPWY